jgi:anti-anti-sigma factor
VIVDLSVTSREQGGRTVVVVGGEIDVYTAPVLRERLNELVAEGHHQLVVDMESVEFLDSTGLGVLVGGLKKVRQHDGSLHLVCTTTPSRRRSAAEGRAACLATSVVSTRRLRVGGPPGNRGCQRPAAEGRAAHVATPVFSDRRPDNPCRTEMSSAPAEESSRPACEPVLQGGAAHRRRGGAAARPPSVAFVSFSALFPSRVWAAGMPPA